MHKVWNWARTDSLTLLLIQAMGSGSESTESNRSRRLYMCQAFSIRTTYKQRKSRGPKIGVHFWLSSDAFPPSFYILSFEIVHFFTFWSFSDGLLDPENVWGWISGFCTIIILVTEHLSPGALSVNPSPPQTFCCSTGGERDFIQLAPAKAQLKGTDLGELNEREGERATVHKAGSKNTNMTDCICSL